MSDKNIGQVSILHIGSSAPENTNLVWWNSEEQIHKVYDFSLEDWVPLTQNVITLSTIADLTIIAEGIGLTIGRFFKLSDENDSLALTINSTTIQYIDIESNLIIFDLTASKKYFVSSENLSIDGITGTWDSVQKLLDFSFTDGDIDLTNSYLLTKGKIVNVSKLIKIKLTKLRSSDVKNSIIFTSTGLYFSFADSIANILNVAGGIVGYNLFQQQITSLTQQIQNIILAVTDTLIMGKKITTLETISTATDVANGDTILTAFSKIQKYINVYKTADFTEISSNFDDSTDGGYIQTGDTIEEAFEKVQYILKHFVISSNYEKSELVDGLPQDIEIGDTIEEAFEKVEGRFNSIQEFDFIVDNETDLVAAFTNVYYGKVYVKKNKEVGSSGVYTISNTLFISNILNRYIYFEPGAKIKSTAIVGIQGVNGSYQNSDDSSQSFINNGSVRLVNCNIEMVPLSSGWSVDEPLTGISNISFLDNCIVKISMGLNITVTDAQINAFFNGSKIFSCCYSGCSNLSNCVASYSANLGLIVLDGETGYSAENVNLLFREYYNCYNLFNCFCYGTTESNWMIGEVDYQFTNCVFSQRNTTMIGGRYHGLIGCKKVLQTYYKYVGTAPLAGYNCSIDSTISSTYQIADTAEGGFNSNW